MIASSRANSPYILIVDDAVFNLRFLADILVANNFRVAVASTARKALFIAEKTRPNLILLDIILPDMHGFEVCKSLKQNTQTSEIPVLFLSALQEINDKLQAFDVGGVDYITKPFSEQEVIARIKTHLALQASRQEICLLNAELEHRVQERTQELAREIRHHLHTEKALCRSEEKFRLAFELAPIGMAITSEALQFQQVNHALGEVLGYAEGELLQRSWFDLIHPESLGRFREFYHYFDQGGLNSFCIENRFITKTGEIVYGILKTVALMVDDSHQPRLLSQFIDISDRRKAEESLRYNSLHDSLTRLPNRAFLLERLQATLMQSRVTSKPFAILFIDLDRFKLINDSLGHQAGDQLLVQTADVLRSVLRRQDLVARLGGDEFVILLDNIYRVEDALRIAKQLEERLYQPFSIEGREVLSSASIGIVMGPADYQTPLEILRDADIAMYRAKANGKAQNAIFDREMHTQMLSQLNLESDLRRALETQSLLIYYQPIISIRDTQIRGFEALIRWQHPKHGWIAPSQFIPLAEETGLIHRLGLWVLEEACAQLKCWQGEFSSLQTAKISVNVSYRQLQSKTFLEQLDEILLKTKLPAACLQLELTETMLMEHTHELLTLLLEIKERGIYLSIDDFGTGYSSLRYLHRFPVDSLKVDRSFVQQLSGQGREGSICRTIVSLAHQLGIRAIAEGIENQEQWLELHRLQCDEGQGYLFAKPLAVDRVRQMLLEVPSQWLNAASQAVVLAGQN